MRRQPGLFAAIRFVIQVTEASAVARALIRMPALAIALVLMFAFVPGIADSAHAQPCLNYTSRLHLVGKTPRAPGAWLSCVATSGSYAFCGLLNDTTEQAELWSVDLADPAAPEIVAVTALPGAPGQIVISGDYAYLTWETPMSGGLMIVNVSDPLTPSLANTITFGSLERIAVSGDRLCLLSRGEYGGGRLSVLLLADPVHPTLTGIVDLPLAPYASPQGLAASGNCAFVGGQQTDGCLFVIDLATVSVAAIASVPGIPGDVTVRGRYAFVAARNPARLVILDVIDPLHPSTLAQAALPSADRIYADDDRAYITFQSGESSGFTVVDVTDPAAPSVLGGYGTVGSTRLAIRPDDIMLTDLLSGSVQVVAMGSGAPARPASSFGSDEVGFMQNLSVKGTLAFATGQHAPTLVIDATDPHAPVLLASWPNYCETMLFQGDLAYAACDQQFRILDLADPVAPVVLGSLPMGWPRDLARSGTRVFVADYSLGLKIIDVSNPQAPTLLSSMPEIIRPWAVAVSGSIAYVADGAAGLVIVDATDPAHPVRRLTVPALSRTIDVEVAGAIAYVADEETGVLVYDLTNPLAPSLVSTVEMPTAETYNLDVDGRYLYVSNDGCGLAILDLADPTHPRRAGNLAPAYPGRTYEVAAGDGCIFMADGYGGLSIALPPCTDVTDTTGGTTGNLHAPWCTASPNPSGGATTLRFTLAAPGRVRLEVFDSAGHLVTTLVDREYGAGEHGLAWDGRDETGAKLASGVYLVRLGVGGGGSYCSKVVVRR